MAVAAMAMTVDYAKTRVAFGQTIGRYQGVKHKCADMFIKLELARAHALHGVVGAAPHDEGVDPRVEAGEAVVGVGEKPGEVVVGSRDVAVEAGGDKERDGHDGTVPGAEGDVRRLERPR